MHLITFKDTISPEQEKVGVIAAESQQQLCADYNLAYAGTDVTGKRFYYNPKLNAPGICCIYVYVEDFREDHPESFVRITSFEQLAEIARRFRDKCY